MLEPALHKAVPMGTRVIVPALYLGAEVTGVVSGIASMHVIFGYIVILDESYMADFGEIRALVVWGTELKGINGEDWKKEG